MLYVLPWCVLAAPSSSRLRLCVLLQSESLKHGVCPSCGCPILCFTISRYYAHTRSSLATAGTRAVAGARYTSDPISRLLLPCIASRPVFRASSRCVDLWVLVKRVPALGLAIYFPSIFQVKVSSVYLRKSQASSPRAFLTQKPTLAFYFFSGLP